MANIAKPRAVRPHSEHISGFDKFLKCSFHFHTPDTVGYIRAVSVSTTFEAPDVLNTFSCRFGYIRGSVSASTIASVMGMKCAVTPFLYKGFTYCLYYSSLTSEG